MIKIKIATSILLLFLAGCSDDVAPTAGGVNQNFKMETYCTVPDMAVSLRHTFIILDEAMIVATQSAEDFAQKNQKMRDAVMGLADPLGAIEQGRTSARERITLLVAPLDGSAAKQLFTGCVPGLTAKDRDVLANGQSGASKFFSGSAEDKFLEGAAEFRTVMVGALIQSARTKSSNAAPSESHFFQSLRNFGQVFASSESTRRIVLVTDAMPTSSAANDTDSRIQGFDAAKESNLDFGNSGIYILGAGGEAAQNLARAEAWITAQNGALLGWSKQLEGISFQPAPTTVARFVGTSTYPDGQSLVTKVRIAYDDNGKLVDSWLILTDLNEYAIPLSGQAICAAADACDFRADKGGFAQAWVVQRGSEPTFDEKAPFAGLREWSMKTAGSKLTGDVFDSAVDSIAGKTKSKSIPFTATAQLKATF